MEETEDEPIKKLNAINVGIIKENIGILDLSHINIQNICESVMLPPYLTELNISHNNLDNVSEAIRNQKHLTILDISFNNIKYFDDTPTFCHTIEYLNISNNKLLGPPAWIWFDSPKKLTKLDISCNFDITNSFQQGYFEELIQFETSVTDVKIYNCRLQNYIKLLGTFSKAKAIQAGINEISYLSGNSFIEFPCDGLIKCCDIERLNLSSTQLFNINPNIDIYKNLREIDLSHNEISDLPNEFCHLEYLEVCILSLNHILYLPEDISKLTNLVIFSIDSNELCMLPEKFCSLPNLKKLDLYDNYLCELPVGLNKIEKIDLAQNYLEEPIDEDYTIKKEKLRHNIYGRHDGRKYENNKSESTHAPKTSDDESYDDPHFGTVYDKDTVNEERPPSSLEDWDSDDYWVPHNVRNITPLSKSPWLYFVKKKMAEGNFCPMDMHTVPVAEKVEYEKLCNPQYQYESDGQFDDYSGDNS